MIDDDAPGWLPTAPPSFEQFVSFAAQPVPLLPAIALILAVAYVVGVVGVHRRGRGWHPLRTVSFLSGCALLAATTGLAVENYGFGMFSVFMFQQLTLMIAIPPLLVLGAPGTLALRSAPHRGPGRIAAIVTLGIARSRIVRWLLHPAIAITLFILAFYGLYLGGLADVLLGTLAGHLALEVFFLAAGVLFAVPVLSPDPLPIRQTYLARTLDVFVEMALHAFFGVIIMVTPSLILTAFRDPPAGWDLDPLLDQQIAGGLAWSYGEVPTAIILIYLVHRWYRDDTRRAIQADRRADREGDPDLDEYNAYLSRLQDGRDRDR